MTTRKKKRTSRVKAKKRVTKKLGKRAVKVRRAQSYGSRKASFAKKIDDWNALAKKAIRSAEEANKKAKAASDTRIKTMYKRAAARYTKLAEKAQNKAIEIATSKK